MNKLIFLLFLSVFLFTMCIKKKKDEPNPVNVINTNPGFTKDTSKTGIKGDVIWNGGLHINQVGKCTFLQNDTLIKLAMTKYSSDSVRFEQSIYIKSMSFWSYGKQLVGTLKGNNLSLSQKSKVLCNGIDANNIYTYTGTIENVNGKSRLTITGTETWCKTEECIFDVKYVVYGE